MNIQDFIKLTCLGVVLTAVGSTHSATPEKTATKADYTTTYSKAQAAIKKAASVDSEWRDSKKILGKAKKAAKAGQYAKAIKLANKARAEGELGFSQAQKNAAYLKKLRFYNPNATPEEDLKNLQGFFRKKFPGLPDEEFANGFYAMDPAMRQNWEAIEEFPPYEPTIEDGKGLWNTKFKNGKSYKSCFGSAAVAHKFPRWDRKAGEVETIYMAINACRKANGEKPLKYGKRDMLALHAHMAYQSRGKRTNVVVPKNDPRALAAYKEGKKFYFSRRGQLSMACFHCHFGNAGKKIRTNVLGPALGQTSHWPAYRSKWGSMGSMHRRYKGCNKQVRFKPFGFQSVQYRQLEYFHTYMSNGIPLNGPGARF